MTEREAHASELARMAIHHGATRIIAIGGDGMLNEVVNGFYEDGRLLSCDTILGVVPTGTGCDFARNLDLPTGVAQAIRFALESPAAYCDVGLARFGIANESCHKIVSRYFINVADVGLGGAVATRVNRSGKRLGGKPSFILSTLQTLASYRPEAMELYVDGEFVPLGKRQLLIAIANGSYFGAGMCIGEQARLDDGVFDIVVADQMGVFELFSALLALHRGKTPKSPRIRHLRGREVHIECGKHVLAELDGEPCGGGSVSMTMLPSQIRLAGLGYP